MNEYSFMKKGILTRRVVDLFEPKSEGTTLSIDGIADELRLEDLRRGAWSSEAGFNLDEIKTAVKGLSERNVLGIPSGVSGVYAINDKDLWRTDEQYRKWLRNKRLSKF